MRGKIAEKISRRIGKTLDFEIGVESIKIDEPPSPEMGNFSTNIAMVLAGKLKDSPRNIAERIVENWHDPWFEKIEIAGPGFVNFFLSMAAWREWAQEVVSAPQLLFPDLGKGKKVHLEFVSANPTGPLHIGHGRGAAVGDSIGRLLSMTGYEVFREYYINDAGRQIEKLGESVYLRYKELFGEEISLEDDHYKGDYIIEIAKEIKEKHGNRFLHEKNLSFFKKYAVEKILAGIKDDLKYFRVDFDSWFSEKKLYEEGVVEETLKILEKNGLVYEKDGARWFRATQFGDEKDRVLIRSTGEPTYFFADIAYHRKKFESGYDLIIDLWGADHHGYEPRIRAAMKALGLNDDKLKILFIQLVSLVRGGENVSMSTRAGNFVTLRDVLDEVGVDAARFFFLLRRSDSHLDFDLELAKKKSNENPVYYVQYAHARIASIFRKGEELGYDVSSPGFYADQLTEAEIPLLKKISQWTDIVEKSVRDLSPHRIPFYLVELAREFHQYYNGVKVLVEDRKLRETRLAILQILQYVIREGLNIIGVEAPVRM